VRILIAPAADNTLGSFLVTIMLEQFAGSLMNHPEAIWGGLRRKPGRYRQLRFKKDPKDLILQNYGRNKSHPNHYC
jgi:hypothetical protein